MIILHKLESQYKLSISDTVKDTFELQNIARAIFNS